MSSCQQTITEHSGRGTTLLYFSDFCRKELIKALMMHLTIWSTGPGLYIGSLYSAASWSNSHIEHKNLIMAGRNVGTKAPPMAEICAGK